MSHDIAEDNVKHQLETLASNLEFLATRIRKRAKRFEDGGKDPVITAAEVVSEYEQAIGNNGSVIWGLIYDAHHLSRLREDTR